MIAYTSRLSLKSELPKLRGLRARVYDAIANADAEGPGPCISELAVKLGMKEGSVCGRINELRVLECIQDGPVKVGPCGKEVKTYVALAWRADDPMPQQPELFQ